MHRDTFWYHNNEIINGRMVYAHMCIVMIETDLDDTI